MLLILATELLLCLCRIAKLNTSIAYRKFKHRLIPTWKWFYVQSLKIEAYYL